MKTKKIILFTLAVAALVLAGCGEARIACPATMTKYDQEGGKATLVLHFEIPWPQAVRVKGTDSVEVLRGYSGDWISAAKYDSTEQTAILIDKAGKEVGECSYDAKGGLIASQ